MAEPAAADMSFSEFSQQSKLEVLIVGLVGGPGSGKGTQCERLAKIFPSEHLSIGDTMRAEIAVPGSPYAEIIKENMSAGRVGPPELTIGLPRRRMEAAMSRGIRTFILDGFPRSIDQCDYLERSIAPVHSLIVLDCSDDVLFERLAAAKRDRFDDKENDIVFKRIRTFRDTTIQVIAMLESQGRTFHIDGEQEVNTVAEEMRAIMQSVMDGERVDT